MSLRTYIISFCVCPRQYLLNPELYMYLMCSESIVRYLNISFRTTRIDDYRDQGDGPHLISPENPEIYCCGIALFEHLRKGVHHVPCLRACEKSEEYVKISWQLPLHPSTKTRLRQQRTTIVWHQPEPRSPGHGDSAQLPGLLSVHVIPVHR